MVKQLKIERDDQQSRVSELEQDIEKLKAQMDVETETRTAEIEGNYHKMYFYCFTVFLSKDFFLFQWCFCINKGGIFSVNRINEDKNF